MANPSAAALLRQYLVSEGLFTNSSKDQWMAYVASMPASKKGSRTDVACFYDTAGVLDGRCMRDGETYTHPGVQLRIRAKEYTPGFSKIEEARKFLEKVANIEVILDSETYILHNVSLASLPVYLGTEPESSRYFEWTVNFLVTISEKEEE
jgi:hypothetical protein